MGHPTSKVFGIGLSRTGTTSLTEGLTILGYSTYHFPLSLRQIDRYEALTDITIASRYKDLDLLYPRSRFILTTREVESWLDSIMAHYRRTDLDTGIVAYYKNGEVIDDLHGEDAVLFHHETNVRLYGQLALPSTRELFIRANDRHREEVMHHFRDRPGDLLVIDIASGQGWAELCPFLGRPVPAVPFPRKNARRM